MILKSDNERHSYGPDKLVPPARQPASQPASPPASQPASQPAHIRQSNNQFFPSENLVNNTTGEFHAANRLDLEVDNQKLDGRQLEVRRYFPCIARAEGDTVERRSKKPNPLTVKANIKKIKWYTSSR
ncbi:hypothetical protein DPMN_175970 [Dreissena polymorpha]|uniref:Uncharacterized protein n=1 Tax=Dreissena polymorpha TaxID=45954 RepID=A0A9D4IK44_DREPO|nr:hypothetical protein DPMN_175970 [Dreissena polymorpha]